MNDKPFCPTDRSNPLEVRVRRPHRFAADQFIPQSRLAQKKRRAAEFAAEESPVGVTPVRAACLVLLLWVGVFGYRGGPFGFGWRLDQYDLTGLDVAQLFARFFFDCVGVLSLQAVDLVLELLV
jgi:hypothetical protein